MPKFLPLNRPIKASGAGVQALGHRLTILELAGSHERTEFLQRIGPHFHMLGMTKASSRMRFIRMCWVWVIGIGWPS